MCSDCSRCLRVARRSEQTASTIHPKAAASSRMRIEAMMCIMTVDAAAVVGSVDHSVSRVCCSHMALRTRLARCSVGTNRSDLGSFERRVGVSERCRVSLCIPFRPLMCSAATWRRSAPDGAIRQILLEHYCRYIVSTPCSHSRREITDLL